MKILEEPPTTEPPAYDFSGMTDPELVLLQSEMRKSPFPEDKEFLDAILKELGRRQTTATYRCVTCSRQYNQSQLTPDPQQPTGDHWICSECGGMVLLKIPSDHPLIRSLSAAKEETQCQ